MNIIRLLVSIFKEKVKRFRKFTKRQRLSICIGFLLTWTFLFIRISLAENLAFNSDDLYILACEMVTESGPKFHEAAKCHKERLEEYKTLLEQRKAGSTLQWIVVNASKIPGVSWLYKEWDEYTTEKGIVPALQILERVIEEPNELKIVLAIWEAGEKLLDFREEMVSFNRVGSIRLDFPKSNTVPKEFQTEIQNAIDDSRTKCGLFVDGKSWETAWAVCEANRKAVLLLFHSRSKYKRTRKHKDIEDLKEIILDSRNLKYNYSQTLAEYDPAKKLVTLFFKSDERRLGILTALENNDMDTVRYLICDAKDEVIENKITILKIASELGFLKNTENSDFIDQ